MADLHAARGPWRRRGVRHSALGDARRRNGIQAPCDLPEDGDVAQVVHLLIVARGEHLQGVIHLEVLVPHHETVASGGVTNDHISEPRDGRQHGLRYVDVEPRLIYEDPIRDPDVNVRVGPARIHVWCDDDRRIARPIHLQ